MIVYIDSNIFFDDPYLVKPSFSVVLEKVRDSNGVIKMPEVVYSETLNNLLSKNISEARNGLRKPDKQITKYLAGSGLEEKYKLPILDDNEIKLSFENRYQELTTEGVLEIINHNTIDKDYLLKDLMDRALNCIRPFSVSKEEFKDTIIWHTVIEDIKQNKYTKCFFISNNNSDFFEEKSVDNKIKVASFHEDLLKDIPEDVQLLPFRSLKDMIEEIEELSEASSDDSLTSVGSDGIVNTTDHGAQAMHLEEEDIRNIIERRIHEEMQMYFVEMSKTVDGRFKSYFPLIALGVNYISNVEELYKEVLLKINRITNISAFKIKNSIKVICSVHLVAIMDFLDFMGDYTLRDYEENEFMASVSFSIDNDNQITDFDISGISSNRPIF